MRPVVVEALRDVSFRIDPGESVGFMGRNGSGKTTLLRLIAGVFRPSSGQTVCLRPGRVVARARSRLPSGLHRAARTSISAPRSTAFGASRSIARLDEIVAFSELEQFIDLPIRTYSAGMHMRLGFSVAVNVDADVLLLDEVFAVGDEAFQRKCIGRILDFKKAGKDDRLRVPLRRGARADVRSRVAPPAGLASSTTARRARPSVVIRSSSPARRIPPSGLPGCASGAVARPV